MDYFISVVTAAAGLYFHGCLYVRIKRWMDRDLTLSLAGAEVDRQAFMLQRLSEAQAGGITRRDLQRWLERAATD
ncbi:MAG: hypothetical protein ACRERX_03730 [Pseudomonas sp.]